MKFDTGKSAIHLIPPECILAIGEVFAMGAKKYGENNWRHDTGRTTYGRTYASIQRHLLADRMGEDLDSESGLPHLAHAMTQLCILMIQKKQSPEMDDRWPKQPGPIDMGMSKHVPVQPKIEATPVTIGDLVGIEEGMTC